MPGAPEGLSDERIEEFKEAFRSFDKDNDGLISSAELGVVMRSLGQDPSRSELNAMIADVDADGDGNINFEEFVRMMAKMMDLDVEFLGDIFKLFDQDADGYLNTSDLRLLMRRLGEDVPDEEIMEMIQEADLDEDGKVNLSRQRKFCFYF